MVAVGVARSASSRPTALRFQNSEKALASISASSRNLFGPARTILIEAGGEGGRGTDVKMPVGWDMRTNVSTNEKPAPIKGDAIHSGMASVKTVRMPRVAASSRALTMRRSEGIFRHLTPNIGRVTEAPYQYESSAMQPGSLASNRRLGRSEPEPLLCFGASIEFIA